MTTHKSVSTPTHIESLGGETRTHIVEGGLIGAGVGILSGALIAVMVTQGKWPVLNLEGLSTPLVYLLFIAGAVLCCASAGAVVGVGVPKFNPHPDQGPIKSWRSVVRRKDGHREVIYVPEEKRHARRQSNYDPRHEPPHAAPGSEASIAAEKASQTRSTATDATRSRVIPAQVDIPAEENLAIEPDSSARYADTNRRDQQNRSPDL